LATAVARVLAVLALAAAAGCANEPDPPLEGLWVASAGRGVHWNMTFRDEGGGVIGRASYILDRAVFSDAPVYGPYPEVHWDVRVDRPVTAPASLPLTSRFVFSGRVRPNCSDQGDPCIRGTAEYFADGRPVSSTPLEFYRYEVTVRG
jgi:hypothetical protein